MSNTEVHLSAIAGAKLLDSGGVRLGRAEDLIVRLGARDQPPRVTGLKARIGGRDLFVPARQVVSLAPGAVRLSTSKPRLAQFQRRPGEVLLRGDVLGRSLIDVTRASLVRSREIELRYERDVWRISGVDTGFGASLRRVLPRRWRRRRTGGRRLVPWSQLEPFVGHLPGSRLRLAARLLRLHPAQLADLVEAASHDEGEEILEAVEQDAGREADVFEELDEEHRVEFLRDRSDPDVAALLANLAGDDAADLLMQLDQDRRIPVLNLMPAAERDQVRGLLRYNPETAGGLMNPEFVAISEQMTVGGALTIVRASQLCARDLQAAYATDRDGRLIGQIQLADLVRATETDSIAPLLERDIPAVPASADVPEVGRVMTDYDLLSLPVLDSDGRIIGAVALDDLVERMLPSDWRRRHRSSRQ